MISYKVQCQSYTYTHINIYRGFAAEEEKTTTQIRAEIDSHLAGKRKVETTLPQSIVIGPFYVNTDSVRLALAKKHKEIARALLDFLVDQLREDTEQVHLCVCGIHISYVQYELSMGDSKNRFISLVVTFNTYNSNFSILYLYK